VGSSSVVDDFKHIALGPSCSPPPDDPLRVEQKLRHSHNKPQRFDYEKELLSDTSKKHRRGCDFALK
jgi:hypothetical protein